MKITIVVGNPKPGSRTGHLARMLIERLFDRSEVDLQVIDLADHSDDLFAWPSEKMTALTDRVADSDLTLFASPTYKASYTGLLKAFLDRYPQNGLNRVVALVLMTGTGRSHSLAPNVALIPLLLELGAVVPVRGFYFNTDRIDQADEIVSGFSTEILQAFAKLAPVIQRAAPRTQDGANGSEATPADSNQKED